LAVRRLVSEGPACPVPITIASKFCAIFQPSNEVKAMDGTRDLAAWELPNDTPESTAIKLDFSWVAAPLRGEAPLLILRIAQRRVRSAEGPRNARRASIQFGLSDVWSTPDSRRRDHFRG